MAEPYVSQDVEKEILQFWKDEGIYPKVTSQTASGKPFYFLDGPPYTSGKVHLGTAWNKALKDSLLRYKRMQGFNVHDRAGYDMHGLPTEHATMKELKLKSKQDILDFGVKKFTDACKKLCIANMKEMNKDFIREGVWMNFEDPYQSVKDEYIEAVWWLVKTAHDKKRLYEGLRTAHWCPDCGTALAKHELEYREVSSKSIFMKFPVVGKKNEFLVIWTTTPWTIPFNLGVMVNPELEYVRAKVDDEVWILAKALAAPVVQVVADKKLNIVEEFLGEELEGLKYKHPFHAELKKYYDVIKKESPKAFTVLLSKEYVDTSAGTGLVHMAPGGGPEDYEIGHRNGIAPFNLLSEHGVFPEDAGAYAGWTAKVDDSKFIDFFEDSLIASTPVTHDYAHCDRCKHAIVYRTTKQWFFKVEDLKKKMLAANKKIEWVPEAAFNAFNSWLENLRDNSITKQRFWGTPLPVWRCSGCGEDDVLSSRKEIEKLSGKKPSDLHKASLDAVSYACACGGVKARLPDILDVWLDAGSAAWASLGFPQSEKEFKKFFPADFILEGNDQIRGWFNLLMVASMVTLEKPSFKGCYMHGMINDAKGRKMSKSIGNYIVPAEAYEKFGADTFRYYAIGGANPAMDLNYNEEDMSVKHRNLGVLWNLHNYLIDLVKTHGIKKADMKLKSSSLGLPERYILSKLNTTIAQVTTLFDAYKLNEVAPAVESLYLALSREYIQLIRDKVATGSVDEKSTVVATLYYVLFETLKLFAPVAPFIVEKMYLNLREEFGLKEKSIHLHAWPKSVASYVDSKLENQFECAQQVIQGVLSGRDKIQTGIRWPLAEAIVVTEDKDTITAIGTMKELIQMQTNVREILVKSMLPGITTTVMPDHKQLGPDFGKLVPGIVAQLSTSLPETILQHLEKEGKHVVTVDGEDISIVKEHLIFNRAVPEPYTEVSFRQGHVYMNSEVTSELETEGYVRELMRRVQSARKSAGLEKTDSIDLFIQVDEMELDSYAEQIASKVGASAIEITASKPSRSFKHSSKETIRKKEFLIAFSVSK